MSEKNQHWRKAFDTPYLGSQDLDDYKDLTLTIKEVKYEMSKKLKKNGMFNVVYFKEPGYKPMLLNATNSKTIKFIAETPYINEWKNIKITIYVEQNVEAFGSLHDALRIRKIKNLTKEILTPAHPKWSVALEKVKGGMTITALRKHYDISEANYNILKSNK